MEDRDVQIRISKSPVTTFFTNTTKTINTEKTIRVEVLCETIKKTAFKPVGETVTFLLKSSVLRLNGTVSIGA